MSSKPTVIVCETRDERPKSRALQRDVIAGLERRSAIDTVVCSHLYDLTPDGPSMEHLRSVSGDLIVVAWMYPRAAFWALSACDVQGRCGRTSFDGDRTADEAQTKADDGDRASARTIWCIDLHRHENAEPLLVEVDRLATESMKSGSATALPPNDETAPTKRLPDESGYRWYPLIDYERCVNCLECLNFCLFGVFGVDTEGQLLVEQPDACRNGCPACSRVCPSTAIMFPRNDNPAIAGDWAMPAKQADLGLVQLFGDSSPQQTAAAERDAALRQQAAERGVSDEDLDQLVDDLDEMDI